jgi:RNA recognition motif-containing protein
MSQYNSGSGYRTRPGGSQRDGSRNYGQHSGGRQEGGGGYNKHGGYQQGRKPFNNNRGGYQSQYQARTNVYNQGGSRPNDSLQIWMGDLDPSWTEESIMKIWTSMGEKPKAAKIMRDRNTPPKPSYCFVTFASQQDVSGAMQKNGLLIPGTTKILKLNWASGSAKGNVPTQQNGHPHSHDSAIKNDFSLFVGDLASDVSESMLFSKFNAKYPNQVSLVKIMFDPVTRLTKGFGFIRLASAETQKRALNEMNGTIIGSRPIRLGMAAGGTAAPLNNQNTTPSAIKSDVNEVSKIQITQAQPALTKFTDLNNTTLMVAGLSSKFTEVELAKNFLSFGDIISCTLSSNLDIGYVRFYLRSSAESAILFLHGSILNDCNLKITWGNIAEAQLRNKIPSAAYIKTKPSPIVYGTFASHNVRFDKIPREQANNTRVVEPSESLQANTINEVYVEEKSFRDEILNCSY